MPRFRENIKKMSAYQPPLEGRAEKPFLLLDFNERTVPVSPKVGEALKQFIDQDRLQAYPEYGDLEEKIAQYAGVEGSQALVTNGADQGIDIICRAHLSEGDKALIPFPAFAMHYQSSLLQGAEVLEPAYDAQTGSFPLAEVLALIENEPTLRLIILCNPNNPLGVVIPLEDVGKITKAAQEKDIAVLHDEAYFEFSGLTAKGLIKDYDNLYIVRTFAKAFGLVSARVGYVLAQEANIKQLLKIRGPYDVNMFAKTAVLAALQGTDYMLTYVDEVMRKSKPMLERFLKEKGVAFFPSRANFLFLPLANAPEIIEKLKERGILVRPKKGPDGKEGVRASIGTVEDTERFIAAFSQIKLDR